MNIVTPTPAMNLNTANVYTELARRDNQLREVIPAPAPNAASNTENKAQSDADKARQPSSADSATYDATGKLADEQTVQTRDEQAEQEQAEQQQEEQQQEEQVLAQEQEVLAELKARDTEVRTHEQAHASVGGQYAGSPSYGYERGSDGNNYAVSGEVQIDVAEVPNDPQATVDKMQTVRAAALAPAEPSSADRAIAADANQKLAAAQAELASAATDDEQSSDSDKASLNIETSTAQSEQQSAEEQTVQARAQRIANFYQLSTSPVAASAFSAQV